MPNPVAENFEEYLSVIPEERVDGTRAIMELMRKELTGCDERVQWGMAIFSHDGRDITGVAARKGFYSLYVPNGEIVKKYVPLLGKVDAGKGCIRFKDPDEIKKTELRKMIREMKKLTKD